MHYQVDIETEQQQIVRDQLTISAYPELYEVGVAFVDRLLTTDPDIKGTLRDLCDELEVKRLPGEKKLEAVFYKGTQCGPGSPTRRQAWQDAAMALLMLGIRQADPDNPADAAGYYWRYIRRVWPAACGVKRKTQQTVEQQPGGPVIVKFPNDKSNDEVLMAAIAVAETKACRFVRDKYPVARLDVFDRCIKNGTAWLSAAVPGDAPYLSCAAWTDAYQRLSKEKPTKVDVLAVKSEQLTEPAKQPVISFVPYSYDARCDDTHAGVKP